MGGQPSRDELMARDFTWSETDEPHATRRKEIIKKYPEIKTLFGPEPRTFWIVLAIFLSQVTVAYFMQDARWWVFLTVAYVFGGTVNHSLQLASHELSHNLAFETVAFNKMLAIFANLATGVPSGMTFIKYHMDHHQYQGHDGIDTDVPTEAEVRFFTSAPRKALWMLLQPAFYAIRPLYVKPMPPAPWEIVNAIVQISFDVAIVYFFGWKSLLYLITGTLLGLGLHPCAGHFVAEHYEFTKGYETYSYYGICNYFNFNVGYHYEHHDFPKIPWSRLPRVREIAPEYYDNLPSYDSYIKVIWKYIMDPEVGPQSRVKRFRQTPKKSVQGSKKTD